MGYFAFDLEELDSKVENTEPMELIDIDDLQRIRIIIAYKKEVRKE